MKINRPKFNAFAPKRLIYEESGGNHGSLSENLNEKRNSNLDKVSAAITESFKAQLMEQKKLNEYVKPIEEEKKVHDQLTRDLKEKLKTRLVSEPNFTGTLTENFSAFGQTVTVAMDQTGLYEDFLGTKPINFQEWAMAEKAKQKPSTDSTNVVS